MRRIILFFAVFVPFYVFSQNGFNRSYIPIGNNPSILYNIIATDTDYKCIGVSNYQYIQGLLYYSLNDTGNITAVKYYGKPSAAYFDNYGENTVKDNNFLLTALTMVHYDTTPNVNELLLYRFNGQDTIRSYKLYSDTVTCSINACCIKDNYYYSVGVRSYSGLGWDILLVKSDSMGNILWIKHYGGNDIDRGYRIIATKDSNLIVAARSYGYYTGNNPHYTNDSQWHIYKIDAFGNIIWDKDYGNPDIRDGFPFGLTETRDSCYLVSGSYAVGMSGSAELLRGRILKIDRNGNILWSKLYGKQATPYTYMGIVKEKTDGNIISIFNDGAGYYSINNSVICELDFQGRIKWFRKYFYNNDTTADASVLNSFDFTADGGYIFAGYGMDYDSVPAQRSWVIKTDSLGFDGVTDFSADTAYRIELTADTCYGDTAVVVAHLYGVTAPYRIAYASYAIHDSLYYSPMYEPYIADTLLLTSAMLTTGDSILQIPVTVTDGLGRVLYDTLQVNVGCLLSSTANTTYNGDILTVYPNPAKDKLLVEYVNISGGQEQTIGLYDMQGHKLKSRKVKEVLGIITFDVSGLPQGTYIIKSGNFTKQISVIH